MKKKSSAEIVEEAKSKVGESTRTHRTGTHGAKEIVEQSKANLAQMKKRTSSVDHDLRGVWQSR